MRRRNNRRRLFDEEKETKKMVTVALSVLIIAILAFVITFVIYSNYLDKGDEIAQFQGLSITELGKMDNQEELTQASFEIGKSINEMQEEENNVNTTNEVSKIAINTSNMEKENVNEKKEETVKVVETKAETKKEEKVLDPTFTKPVEGEVSTQFAKDTLIYSNTLQEWVLHTGIDIKADKTTIVKASAEGTVKSIKNDPRYGITVVIEHVNSFCSIYSNLLTAEFVKEGEKVKQGQTIGTVGNTAMFEISDAPHLHFEILKDNEQLDPELYIK